MLTWLLLLSAVPTLLADVVPVVIIAPPDGELLPSNQKLVNKAIDRGVAYLRSRQVNDGSFGNDEIHRAWPIGLTSLCGLTLLDCGVAKTDRAVDSAARLVRARLAKLRRGQPRTYEISLAILFLDRLGYRSDRALIRSLALILVAGQTPLGGWSYHCPLLNAAQERNVLQSLENWKLRGAKLSTPLAQIAAGMRAPPRDKADNSNTQFATLALLVAQKYNLPLDYSLAQVQLRFRFSQTPKGWSYRFGSRAYHGARTCVGLLGLAAYLTDANPMQLGRLKPKDNGIALGLRTLGVYMSDPTDSQLGKGSLEIYRGGQKIKSYKLPGNAVNLYFLWSVQRVGVLYNLKTIGGVNWYFWGLRYLLPTQRADGSWFGGGVGAYPEAATCFALLFMKRSDLLPDLRKTIQNRMSITDPVMDELKLLMAKQNLQNPQKQAATLLRLENLKANQPTTKTIRVRGPSSFRIKGVKTGGDEIKARIADEQAITHEMTLTITPAKTGDFRHTIYLQTDIPGRSEVPVRIEASVRK